MNMMFLVLLQSVPYLPSNVTWCLALTNATRWDDAGMFHLMLLI